VWGNSQGAPRSSQGYAQAWPLTRARADLEKSGFTHIDARCAACARIVQMPFLLIADAQADHVSDDRRRAAPSLSVPGLRRFTGVIFYAVATWYGSLTGKQPKNIIVGNGRAPAPGRTGSADFTE
jgi:hypothetical protein